MVVLVTGAAGMLGTDVCATAPPTVEALHAADIRGTPVMMDITDAGSVRETMQRIRPNVVVHCAAYTNVDQAERDADSAFRVNAVGSWLVANACEAVGASLCYISTDFVFDGLSSTPYHEFSEPRPLNVYGASKLAGERAVALSCKRHWILRTAWLYGLHGKSFVRTILERAFAGQTLSVVADQTGCPTYTADLARAIWEVVLRAPYGTYHRTNAGSATWYDLAKAVVDLARLNVGLVRPIPSRDWPSPVQRPRYSVLASLAASAAGLQPMRPWREALQDFVSSYEQLRTSQQ